MRRVMSLTVVLFHLPPFACAGPLHNAAIAGDVEAARELLEDGADPNEIDGVGTALNWAMFGQQADVARLLLEYGADPNAGGTGWTPLVSAIKMGDAGLAEQLIEAGADVRAGADLTPLAAAAEEGDGALAKLLLSRGADPNQTLGDEAETPLHFAATSGSLEVTAVLIAAGADIGALSLLGRPPIHYALAGRHDGVAKQLRDAGWRPGPIEPVSTLLADANPARGEQVAETCLNCHRSDAETGGYVGANFWGLIGRPVASHPAYTYSDAIRAVGTVWDFETLNRFVARPSEVAPGTRMVSAGIPDARDRADLIAWIRTLSDDPVPLP